MEGAAAELACLSSHSRIQEFWEPLITRISLQDTVIKPMTTQPKRVKFTRVITRTSANYDAGLSVIDKTMRLLM